MFLKRYLAYYNQGKLFENKLQCGKHISKCDVETWVNNLICFFNWYLNFMFVMELWRSETQSLGAFTYPVGACVFRIALRFPNTYVDLLNHVKYLENASANGM